MTTNQAMTLAAVGLAAFAVWRIVAKPGGLVPTQPGEAARLGGLKTWHQAVGNQWGVLAPALGQSQATVTNIFSPL